MESPFLGFQKSHKDWFKFEKNYVATKIYFEYIFGGKLARQSICFQKEMDKFWDQTSCFKKLVPIWALIELKLQILI